MGKKRNKAIRRKSKRGHVKDLVTRYRQKWVPIDEEGNEIGDTPLAPPPALIPSERKALAKAMLQHTGEKTAVEDSLQPEVQVRPDNVVSLCDRRIANSTEFIQDAQASINYDRILFHQWSKERNKDNIDRWSEFNIFHRREWGDHVLEGEADLVEHRRLQQFDNSHKPDGKKNPMPEWVAKGLPDPRRKSVKKQKPISTVHNPGISSTPIEHGGYINGVVKKQAVGFTPSGRPIKEFLEGGKYPPKQEQKPTEVRPLPITPRAWSAEDQLYTMIDMVPEVHWPMNHLKEFLFQKEEDGSWHVHTGRVRKAIKNQEDRVINRAVTLAFIEYGKDQDEYIEVLKKEHKGLRVEQNLLEFQYTRLIGEEKDNGVMGTPQYIRSLYATVYAKPPKDIDKLVAEFAQFNSHALYETPSRAYARMHYGDPKIADEVEAELERRKEERHRVEAQSRIDAHTWVCWQKFLKQVPYLISLTNDHFRSAHVRPISAKQKIAEIRALRRIGKNSTSAGSYKKANLSGFVSRQKINYARVINKTVGVQHWRRNNPKLVPSMSYWDMRFEPIEPTVLVHYQMVAGKPESYASQYEQDSAVHAKTVQRWEKRLDECFDKTDRLLAQRKFDAAMQKPINKAIHNMIKVGRKLKQIGDTDVFVTPWEQKKRDAAAAAKAAHIEKIEAEQQEKRERHARIEARRAEVKARKEAEKARNDELLRQQDAERQHKEVAKKLYRKMY